jgi:biotin carboxyl carrier protein
MKMEHAIRAPRDGTVVKIHYGEGDLVEAGAVLAEITE